MQVYEFPKPGLPDTVDKTCRNATETRIESSSRCRICRIQLEGKFELLPDGISDHGHRSMDVLCTSESWDLSPEHDAVSLEY